MTSRAMILCERLMRCLKFTIKNCKSVKVCPICISRSLLVATLVPLFCLHSCFKVFHLQVLYYIHLLSCAILFSVFKSLVTYSRRYIVVQIQNVYILFKKICDILQGVQCCISFAWVKLFSIVTMLAIEKSLPDLPVLL